MKKLSIIDANKLAILKDGKCLSSEYINSGLKLLWQCSFNHQWFASLDNIKQDHWCPTCAGQPKIKIEDLRYLANKRGGDLISTNYNNAKDKLIWQCYLKHIWEACYDSVKKTWCPTCNIGISENICKVYFEKIWNKPFPKSRPTWLKNKNGKQLELDGFCEELNLAFEHNGDQHYIKTIFSKNEQCLNKIKENDLIKKELCRINKVNLIIIPQLNQKILLKNLYMFIKTEAEKFGIYLADKQIDIDISNCYKTNTIYKKYTLDFFKNIAVSKNGECLSSSYSRSNLNLKFKCNIHSHIWEARAERIAKGSWCNLCAIESRKCTVADLNIIALKFNGKCLSEKYKKITDEYLWMCKHGHVFLKKASLIKYENIWCQKCK